MSADRRGPRGIGGFRVFRPSRAPAAFVRFLLGTAALVGLFAGTRPARAASAAAPPPNLVFILADDLGKGLLPLYGAEADISTPNLERLAAAGVVFDNAWATPICLPTRTELITGRYPVHNGIAGHTDRYESVFLDPAHLPSFAWPLRRYGYKTALAGKWHGKGRDQSPTVFRAFGFDEWMLVGSQAVTWAPRHDGRMDFGPDDFPADRLADFVVDFIGRHRDRPFFLYYPMALVHRPLVATPAEPEAASDSEKLIAMTEYADRMVGRVLDALEKNGLIENTILFFSGDNGLALELARSPWKRFLSGIRRRLGNPERARVLRVRGKDMLIEPGINVPLIVSGGPVVPRGRTDALTDFTDMLPTLAALAGAPLPRGYEGDGVSIADFLLGRSEDTPRQWIASAAAVDPALDPAFAARLASCGETCVAPPFAGPAGPYWRAADVGVVVRDRRFKLWRHGSGFRGLFDLRSDPNEMVNLWESPDPEAAAARRRLLAALEVLPEGDVRVRARRLTPNHGLHSHWRFDRPLAGAEGGSVFTDWLSGHHAETAAPRMTPGKFGQAVASTSLRAFRFSEFLGSRPSLIQRFTLSAWIQLDEEIAGEATVLRFHREREQALSPLRLLVKSDGGLAARHLRGGLSTPGGLLPRGRWVPVALTWAPADAGWETTLYVAGEARARSREVVPTPLFAGVRPGRDGLEIGGPGIAVDDLAIWRQALTPAQIAALGALGDAYGYDAAEVDALFDAPPDRVVRIGGRDWRRLPGVVDGERFTVSETPDGVREIRFGGGSALRSLPPAGAREP